MKIFAISDLHLAHNEEKKMDIFGKYWLNHFDKIVEDWQLKVSVDDIVLLPGDLSWAMTMDDAAPHLKSICELPGNKVLLRGNHDYWWSSLTKVRTLLFNNTYAVQNDSVCIGDAVICGSRGWILPCDKTFDEEKDRSIFDREKQRLRLSLKSAEKLISQCKRLIVMTHFPPLYPKMDSTDFSKIIEEYPVDTVVFGHLHGMNISKKDFNVFVKNGISYSLVSCDFLDFKLRQI